MRTHVKKNREENRYEYRLSSQRVVELQAMIAKPDPGEAGRVVVDHRIKKWWAEVCAEMGFVADTVTDVRWTARGGQVLAGPPADMGALDCEVSFTAIKAEPCGDARFLTLEYVHELQNQVIELQRQLFYARVAARSMVTDAISGAYSANMDFDAVEWLRGHVIGSTAICEPAAKTLLLIRELQRDNDRLLAQIGCPAKTYSEAQFLAAIKSLENLGWVGCWPDNWARKMVEKVAAAFGLERNDPQG